MKHYFTPGSLLLFILIAFSATAQERLRSFSIADKDKITTLSGQRIKLASPVLNKLKNEVTITLSNESNSEVKSGNMFILELPQQKGYSYDLSTLRWSDNEKIIPATAPSIIYVDGSFAAGSSISFVCKLIKNGGVPDVEQHIMISKSK